MSAPMFVGQFEVLLDGEGMLSLPEEWQFMISGFGKLCLVPDACERCLVLLPKTLFDEEILRLERSTDSEDQKQLDLIRMHYREISVDEQGGRIAIPLAMREKAGILSAAKLVGCIRAVKIKSSSTE